MANYYATARTNYFAVKDAEAFKEAVAGIDALELIEKEGKFGLVVDDDCGGWPSSVYSEEIGDYDDFEIEDFIIPHLADGAVCVGIEAGSEKARYVIGYAFAFNNKGERRSVTLDSIYQLAAELGEDVTTAEY